MQNDNPYAISFIWAQYFSTQRDTVYALPNQTVSFQTVNNPQTPQTFDDDNLTGIWYWGPNWETLRDLERNNLDLNLHCANRLDGVVMAPQANRIPGPIDLAIDPAELIQHAFILSPNPAQDALIIQLREPVDQAVTLTVSNMIGQELMTAHGNLLQPTKLDVSQLSQGIYLVRINTGGTSVSHKFEKIR